MTYQTIEVTETEARLTIMLNRPEALNSLTLDLFGEFEQALAHVATRQDVRVIVVMGAGRAFSAGVDPSVLWQMASGISKSEFQSELTHLQKVFNMMEEVEKPTIAAVNGVALGGGLILALCCDFRIASERAIFGLPEVRIGFPVIMGTHRLTRVVGVARAKELAMTGKRISAQKAEAIGLVNRVVLADQLDQAVDELAGTLAGLAPLALGLQKRIIDRGWSMDGDAAQAIERDLQSRLLNSEDLREGLAALTEKRSPKFVGRWGETYVSFRLPKS